MILLYWEKLNRFICFNWLVRGGGYNNTTNAGVFNFTYANERGSIGSNVSFRLVIGDYDILII